jgi:hypothetical protein
MSSHFSCAQTGYKTTRTAFDSYFLCFLTYFTVLFDPSGCAVTFCAVKAPLPQFLSCFTDNFGLHNLNQHYIFLSVVRPENRKELGTMLGIFIKCINDKLDKEKLNLKINKVTTPVPNEN